MSNRAKFLISLLFLVAIVLAVGVTKFYYDVSQDTGGTADDERIDKILTKYSTGLQLFCSTNGLYGVLDEENAVLIEPEWIEILEVTPEIILVSDRIANEILIGGIDYEENVVMPFVFRSMEPLGDEFYLGVVAADDSSILYDSTTFEPVFSESYRSITLQNKHLILERESCQFTYYQYKGRRILQEAKLLTDIGTEQMEWQVSNPVYLSELEPEGLQQISQHITAYMDMLLSNDFTGLSAISSPEYIAGLSINDSFNGAVFERISDISFSASLESSHRVYDMAFTIEYHTSNPIETVGGQSALMHLYFQKTTDNQMILTSANMDFHSSEPAVMEPETGVE